MSASTQRAPSGIGSRHAGHSATITDINDHDITIEAAGDEEDRDTDGHGSATTGDEPTEYDDDRDAGGGGEKDTGNEA